MAKQNTGGVYANMDFPPYTYVEYPKHISIGPHGQHTTVFNKQEEQELLSKMQKDQDDAPAYIEPLVVDPAKEILISRARELGVAFNAKWSKAKLEQVVKAAEDDVDNLPPEMPAEKKSRIAAPVVEDDAAESVEITPEEYKDSLISQAKSFDIPANKLWGIPRLKASIAEAKAKLKD